jgi:hypothetical protein
MRVTTARKLHGRGRFGGHNLFFNQEIRAELTFAGPSEPIALDEVKRHVLRAFEEWEGWSTRGDWDGLPGRIERAGSVHTRSSASSGRSRNPRDGDAGLCGRAIPCSALNR